MYKVKSEFEIKDVDSGQGVVTGYASIFNVIDSDRDMIMQGAFKKSIKEKGPKSERPRIKHLWQHDSWQPIGIPTVLKEDSKGLYFETKFGTDTFSKDKLQQHIDGIITELSIGYNVIASEKVMKGDQVDYYKLNEIKLWEYSSVTWGANQYTEVIDAKGMNKESKIKILNERLDKLCKALKSDYTDETIENFEIQIKQIQTIMLSLETEEPDDSTPDGQADIKAFRKGYFNH